MNANFTRYDYMMSCPNTPTRQSLSRSVGRLVTVEATYLEEQRFIGKNQHTLCGNLLIYPSIADAHMWVDVPDTFRQRLVFGQRFSFRGVVIEYRRANLSWDYAVAWRAWIGKAGR